MGLHRTTRTTTTELASNRAILVVSTKGRIQFMTSRAARWLKINSFSPSHRRLPDALRGCLREIISSGQPARCFVDRAGTQLCCQIVCREANSVCVLLEQRAQLSESNDARGRLTQRESEVLSWVARGKTNAEIAKILSLKTGTISKYLERIFPKLGVENRTAAASFALGTNHTV